jgi:hypothetical protein
MPKRIWIISALGALYFFPLLWISGYDYPSGDDYRIGVFARQLGPFGTAKWWYFNASGRYTLLFLHALISSSRHWLVIYKLFPVMLFLAGFGCVYFFFTAFFGEGLGRSSLFSVSLAFFVLLISFTPDIATAFYWLTTSIQYTGAVFISVLILGLYIKLIRADTQPGKIRFALLIVSLLAVVAGLNEASVLFLLATLGFVNCFHLIQFRKVNKWALAFLIFGVFFSLISFLAPGNRIRLGANTPETFGFFKLLAGSILLTFYLLIELLATTPILLASIVYLAFLNSHHHKLDQPRALLNDVRWYWVLSLMILAVTAVNFAIFFVAGVSSLADRIKNIYFYSIFFGWFLLITVLFLNISRRKLNSLVPNWITAILVLGIIGFLFTGFRLGVNHENIIPDSTRSQRMFAAVKTEGIAGKAYLDLLSGRASRFARQNEEREAQTGCASGNASGFSLYSYVPETIFIQDVNHPFGQPEWFSRFACGTIRQFDYRATGPTAPLKKKF